jgi:hypothetical protein
MTDKGVTGDKLAKGVQAIQAIMQQKTPRNLYDAILKVGFGDFLDDLIDKLTHDFGNEINVFPDKLKTHRQAIVYLNQLGIKDCNGQSYLQTELDEYEKIYDLMIKASEIRLVEQHKELLKQATAKVDLELTNIKANAFYEANTEKSIAISKKFVAAYLNKIGGKENLSIELLKENPEGCSQSEIVNGKNFLLLMLRELTNNSSLNYAKQAESLRLQLAKMGGSLKDEDAKKLERFVENLDEKYNPVAYHARFSLYKTKLLNETLSSLGPLP